MLRRHLPVTAHIEKLLLVRTFCTVTDKNSLEDEQILSDMMCKKTPIHALENIVKPDFKRAVHLRREFIKRWVATNPTQSDTTQSETVSVAQEETQVRSKTQALAKIPFENYDWSEVVGRNCENVIGYVTIPMGIAGPLRINGNNYIIPMATTEGALVASTSRGARAITESGGCHVEILSDAMTRAPVVALPSMKRACEVIAWCEQNIDTLKIEFRKTTSIGELTGLKCALVGRRVHLRFKAFTGDAMGMNMLTKGSEHLLQFLRTTFPDLKIISVSGNYCTDKKPSAVNWIEGRGKTVAAEVVIQRTLVHRILKSTPEDVCDLHRDKNLVGSALAGSIGGFNAHAANVVAAIYLATGQDPAQVVEGSNCITHYEVTKEGDLYAALTMPALEVGTTGGGTQLSMQRAVLDLIGCGGPHRTHPGDNAKALARLVAGSVLSAELSIMSAQAAGHLVEAHLRLNRRQEGGKL